jgi:hypothetical protein
LLIKDLNRLILEIACTALLTDNFKLLFTHQQREIFLSSVS